MSYTTEVTHERPLAITLPALAKRYKIPRKKAKELAETGVLPTFQMDRRIWVLESDLEAYFLRRIQAWGIASPSGLDSKGGE